MFGFHCSSFEQKQVFIPGQKPRRLRRKMSTETYRHALTTAFKSWHNLAVGAILLALNVFLTNNATGFINSNQTALQGWATLIIAGYAFIAAIYLGASPLSENSTLTESFPGIFDHFRAFIVGGIFYAGGFFLLNVQAPALATIEQMLPQAIALIVGGALLLVAVLIAVAAAFVRPRK